MLKMVKITIIFCFSLAISGCMTTSGSLPKCDGYSKRALNKSMWDWQKKIPQSTPTIVNNFTPENKSNHKFNSVLSNISISNDRQSYKDCE